MDFKSQLNNSYKTASLSWLIGESDKLDPIFASRLSYLAKSKGVKLKITEGYRTHDRQAELYRLYLIYKATGRGVIKSAAKPGTSAHEYRLAVDTSTQPFRGMTNSQLKPYGLIKPISSEGWHIQPIETLGVKDFPKLAPLENDMTEKEVRKLIAEMNPVYETLSDVPAWGKDAVSTLIKEGKIKPDNGKINLSHDMVRMIVILGRG